MFDMAQGATEVDNGTALGGVDADNAATCLEAGATGVAVMGGVMKAADPEGVVAALVDRIKTFKTTRS